MGHSRPRLAQEPLSNYLAKDFDSGRKAGCGEVPPRNRAYWSKKTMGTEKTCAACDCKLDEGAIKVKLGGKIVEVCCDECARKLKEAHNSAANQ
jgi:hypothetical protein